MAGKMVKDPFLRDRIVRTAGVWYLMFLAFIVALLVVFTAGITGDLFLQSIQVRYPFHMISLVMWILIVIELCKSSLERLYYYLTDPVRAPRTRKTRKASTVRR